MVVFPSPLQLLISTWPNMAIGNMLLAMFSSEANKHGATLIVNEKFVHEAFALTADHTKMKSQLDWQKCTSCAHYHANPMQSFNIFTDCSTWKLKELESLKQVLESVKQEDVQLCNYTATQETHLKPKRMWKL